MSAKKVSGNPASRPRKTSDLVRTSPNCRPLLEAYEAAEATGARSWNEVEESFLRAMSEFDTLLASTIEGPGDDGTRKRLAADLQNGKGDAFNDLLALLLENCSGVEHLYARGKVPGLIIAEHNLDGVYPGDPKRQIGFLLEAKMMGTPKHAGSPGERDRGRMGSADTGKRVKELAFKSIDLKGEASRRLTMLGQSPSSGGAGGGDLSTWLHTTPPLIYFFMAVRVVSDTDFNAVVRWAHTATQVVDAVGLYCYRPVAGAGWTTYERQPGVPTVLQLERVLFRACQELQRLKVTPMPETADVPVGPAVAATDAEHAAETSATSEHSAD